MDRCTFGIEITSMQLSGKDIFSVWDFAGQVENFITHQFFISTQSTVFTVLINLTDSLEEQRKQLLRWLGFIKMRNLGQVRRCVLLLNSGTLMGCIVIKREHSFCGVKDNLPNIYV